MYFSLDAAKRMLLVILKNLPWNYLKVKIDGWARIPKKVGFKFLFRVRNKTKEVRDSWPKLPFQVVKSG